jgi:hypothetical protein
MQSLSRTWTHHAHQAASYRGDVGAVLDADRMERATALVCKRAAASQARCGCDVTLVRNHDLETLDVENLNDAAWASVARTLSRHKKKRTPLTFSRSHTAMVANDAASDASYMHRTACDKTPTKTSRHKQCQNKTRMHAHI